MNSFYSLFQSWIFAHGAHLHASKLKSDPKLILTFFVLAVVIAGLTVINWKSFFPTRAIADSNDGTSWAIYILLFGFFLLGSGSFIYLVYAQYNFSVAVFHGVGAGLIVGVLTVAGSHLSNLLSAQSFFFNFMTIVGTIAVVLILVFANYLGQKHSKKFDFTKDKLETLSDKSKKVIQGLKRRVEIVGFFYKEEKQTEMGVRNFLLKYRAENPDKFLVRFYNPIERNDLATCYGIKDEGVNKVKNRLILARGTCVLGKNGRYRLMDGDEKGRKVTIKKLSEKGFTNKLIRLTREKRVEICFLRGRMQPSIKDGKRLGMSVLKDTIEEFGFKTSELDLSAKTKVPEECDVLINASPERGLVRALPKDFRGTRLSDPELAKIERYLNNGGSMLIAQDPEFYSGLEGKIMKQFGVKWSPGLVQDYYMNQGNQASKFFAINFTPNHDITRGFIGRDRASLLWSSRVEVMKKRPSGVTSATSLLRTTKIPTRALLRELRLRFRGKAPNLDCCSYYFPELQTQKFARWNAKVRNFQRKTVLINILRGVIKRNFSKAQAGPISLATASTRKVGKRGESRLIVLGDTSLVSNIGFHLNQAFVLNSLSWLANERDLVYVKSRMRKPSTVVMTKNQKNLLRYTTRFGMPMLFFFAILFVMVRRLR